MNMIDLTKRPFVETDQIKTPAQALERMIRCLGFTGPGGVESKAVGEKLLAKVSEVLAAAISGEVAEPMRKRMMEAAKGSYGKDGEIEVDDSAKVSCGGDPGAYVEAWVWVQASEAGYTVCEKCESWFDTDDTEWECPDCRKTPE